MPNSIFHIGSLMTILIALTALTGCDKQDHVDVESIRPVKTLIINHQDISNNISLIGDVEAERETSLGFRIGGRVLERNVRIGDKVNKGELIATIDPRDAQHQLQTAKATLENAHSAENLARKTRDRYQKLIDQRVISQSQFDQAQNNLESAVSSLESAKANLKNAQDNLEFTRLLAPESGIIVSVSANLGQVISVGQEIIKIASLDDRNAVFDVPETIINSGIKNPAITVSLQSNPEVNVIGTVRDVSPQADPNTRTYSVRVKLHNPPMSMGLGAIVKGTISLQEPNVIELPESALTRDGKQTAVYLFDPESQTLKIQPIEVVRYSNQSIFVSRGLTVGQHIVIAGVSTLRPGLKVSELGE
ncbi:efflux RND transporter periplasmic adaptor subunit [Marinomonas lutimaris]|jgi:RND family efflux transporter MFP subunit|uniref:efflux RND transporter periplasmic adaptor subunit n=1 Tax=Marinomonas lutimaris TaxID=2846746 RepID=UPI001CA57663|nr:efflux RND transporter periplasmic adaptor subunit [Marinomonas lutimaris]